MFDVAIPGMSPWRLPTSARGLGSARARRARCPCALERIAGVGRGGTVSRRMLGADERLVDADEVRRLEPNLRAVLREAIWRPRDGAVDPVALSEALIDAARRHGAQVRLGESVRGLRMQGGAVVGSTRPWGLSRLAQSCWLLV